MKATYGASYFCCVAWCVFCVCVCVAHHSRAADPSPFVVDPLMCVLVYRHACKTVLQDRNDKSPE